jgi:hypothetical protein
MLTKGRLESILKQCGTCASRAGSEVVAYAWKGTDQHDT